MLYDPPGADSGLEYVELAASAGADTTASLAGWVVQTGNGAQPGVWTVAWAGAPGDRLRGGLFVIGEAEVRPAPDVVVNLDLQNGPDACRLMGPAGEEDRLGWGTPLDASFFEGAPAQDVSVARPFHIEDERGAIARSARCPIGVELQQDGLQIAPFVRIENVVPRSSGAGFARRRGGASTQRRPLERGGLAGSTTVMTAAASPQDPSRAGSARHPAGAGHLRPRETVIASASAPGVR